MIREQLTFHGRFELLVILFATDPILYTQPSHVMPQTVFHSACMPHLKKRCKDLPILGYKLIVSDYELLSCDIVHISTNAVAKPAAFIFRAEFLKTESAVSSVALYLSNKLHGGGPVRS
jgi:hypothetical protein